MKKLIIVFGTVIFLSLVTGGIYFFEKQSPSEQNPPEVQTPENQAPDNQNSETKIYRNEEWGFEFKYPKDWVVKENTFGSYYSKFNMVIRPTVGQYSRFPVDVNIVLSEFPEYSFKNVEKITSEVTVDGILGIKYQYEFGAAKETAIILPLEKYRIILGTDDEKYKDTFNQVLTSFKFLK